MVASSPPPAPACDSITPIHLRLRSVDGVVLAADRYPPPRRPAQPPVLFAHGFGQTRKAWAATARRVAAAGHEAVAVDGRGHGESGWNPPPVPYRLEQFVGDVHAVADVQPAPPVWVGASMGGLLGLLAAGEASDGGAAAFHGLVLVDITPRWESAGVERILGFMRAHPGGFDSLAHAIEAIASYMPHRRRKSPEQLSSLFVPDGTGGVRWHWDPRLLDELAHESEQWQERLMAAARRLKVPTLLVSGGRSDLVSDATVEEFLALAPHAAHVRIDEATHMVAGDRNDAFTDAVLDFLRAVDQASAACPATDAHAVAPAAGATPACDGAAR